MSSPPDSNSSQVSQTPSRLQSALPFYPDHDPEHEEFAGVPSDDDDDGPIFSFARPDTPPSPAASRTDCEMVGTKIPIKHAEEVEWSNSLNRCVSPDAAVPKLYKDSSEVGGEGYDDSIATTIAPPAAFLKPQSTLDPEDPSVLLSYRPESDTARGKRFSRNMNQTPFTSARYSRQTPRTAAAMLRSGLRRRPRAQELEHSVGLDSTVDTLPDYTLPDYEESAVEMDLVRPLDVLYDRQMRPHTRWNISELGGTETVPDGRTTTGVGTGANFSMASETRAGGRTGSFVSEEEDSPYAEVRASVSNIDDPDMPGECPCLMVVFALRAYTDTRPSCAVLTVRSMSIGLVICSILAGLNTYARFRDPGIYVQPVVTQ